MNKVNLFNITIDNVTMTEAVNRIQALVEGKSPAYVVTPNVDHVVKLQKDQEFLDLYEKAHLVIPDGMPLVWVSRLVKRPLKERVTGADLFLQVCERAEKTGMSLYLLGSASQDIIETTKKNLLARYPGLKIVGVLSPSFGFEKKETENAQIAAQIKAAAPDILFVGVGAPKQEKWIYKNYQSLGVPVSLGVGAAFDFVAGNVKRAPVWMQKIGLEWFYRFLSEPRRMFKRYFIDDFAFLFLTLKELGKKKKPHA